MLLQLYREIHSEDMKEKTFKMKCAIQNITSSQKRFQNVMENKLEEQKQEFNHTLQMMRHRFEVKVGELNLQIEEKQNEIANWKQEINYTLARISKI